MPIMIQSPTQPGHEHRMPPHFKRSTVLRFLFCLLLWSVPPLAPEARAAGYSVSQVQAAFLFNFAQFTKWPARAFPQPSSPLTIGVLGANPFGGALESTVGGETVDGHRMAVKYSRRADDLKSCQIVFISQSEAAQLDATLAAFQGTSVLTVSDVPRFCQRGGMINFIIDGGKVRFEINSSAARSAGLQISSKLLKIAQSGGN